MFTLREEYMKNESFKTPFGDFTVKCNKCDSTNIELDNSLGYSVESGGWGSLDLHCVDCGNRIEIFTYD